MNAEKDLRKSGATSYAVKIRQLANQSPDAKIFRHIGLDGAEPVFTWSDLDLRSGQLASALAGKGLGLGDRLGIGLHNSPEFMFCVLAAWKIGAVPIPLRWDLPNWEFSRLKSVIQAKLHLGGNDLPWIRATEDLEVPDLPEVVSPHMNGICSSGSTGTPKVILIRYPAVYNEVFSTPFASLWQQVPRPQTILVMGPMYHTNGFSMLNYMFAGDHLVVMEKFDAACALDVIERYSVSTFAASPTMLQRLAEVSDIEHRDLSSLEWILQGAAPLPHSLFDRWAELIGAEKIYIAYGQSEAVGITAMRGNKWKDHSGSVGRPVFGTEVRIIDDENNELPIGEVGNVCMRSVNYSGSNYLGGHAQMTSIEDGFVMVGDLGKMDAEGYLYIADRRADLVISGGANVYPAEVEAALIDHPQVSDVVVIGLRDEQWGRRVHALIEPKDPTSPPSLEDIVSYAKSRLAAYKVPKSVEFLSAMPRSEATKINRGALVAERGG